MTTGMAKPVVTTKKHFLKATAGWYQLLPAKTQLPIGVQKRTKRVPFQESTRSDLHLQHQVSEPVNIFIATYICHDCLRNFPKVYIKYYCTLKIAGTLRSGKVAKKFFLENYT